MIKFYPLIPVWLIVLCGAAGIYLVWFTAKFGLDMSKSRRYALMIIRLTVLALAIVMLLSPGIVVREQNRQRSNVVFLLDGSGSMNTRDLADGASRFEGAYKFLSKIRGSGYSGSKKHFYLFSSKAAPMDDSGMEMYSPDGGTDLKRAFETIDKDIGFSRTAAVIVVSDGIDHSDFTGTHAGLPVFAAKFGSELNDVQDLRIDRFRHPQTLRTNEELDLEVPVTLSGYNDKHNVNITFFVDGKEVKKDALTLIPRMTEKVKFSQTFTTPGIHTVKIVLDQIKGEAGYLNNEREFAVEVKTGKSRTVCYFPKLTNSFRPLLRLFRSTGKKFTAVYRLGDDRFNVIGSEIDNNFRNGLPKSAAKLRQVDVLVLGATRQDLLSPAEQSVLEQYVMNGGNLIILGGMESFGELSTKSPLYGIMPVRSNAVDFVTGSFNVVVPEKAESSFSERMAELCGKDAVIRGLNRISGIKEGAEVLLEAEAQNRYPLVVSLPYGQGRAVAVLTNSLHLWGRGKQREINFGIFWEQLINYAGKSRDDILKVSVNRSELLPDDKLKVTAIASVPEKDRDDPEFKIESTVYPVKGTQAEAVRALIREGNIYTAEFPSLSPGRYMLKTVCRVGSRIIRQRYNLILVGERINENYDLKVTNDNFLKFCSAGRVYGPDEADRLVRDVITTVQKNDIEREWYPVFETPFFFAAVIVLLMAGWYLRRKYNLF